LSAIGGFIIADNNDSVVEFRLIAAAIEVIENTAAVEHEAQMTSRHGDADRLLAYGALQCLLVAIRQLCDAIDVDDGTAFPVGVATFIRADVVVIGLRVESMVFDPVHRSHHLAAVAPCANWNASICFVQKRIEWRVKGHEP
jgi:hypothetical protein